MSCNLWIPHESDSENRICEAATKFLFASIQDTASQCGVDTQSQFSGWENPSFNVHDIAEDIGDCENEDLQMKHATNLSVLMDACFAECGNRNGTLSAEIDLEPNGSLDIDMTDINDILQALVNTVLHPDVMKTFARNLRTLKESKFRRDK